MMFWFLNPDALRLLHNLLHSHVSGGCVYTPPPANGLLKGLWRVFRDVGRFLDILLYPDQGEATIPTDEKVVRGDAK